MAAAYSNTGHRVPSLWTILQAEKAKLRGPFSPLQLWSSVFCCHGPVDLEIAAGRSS